jgi:hypothetical protein
LQHTRLQLCRKTQTGSNLNPKLKIGIQESQE